MKRAFIVVLVLTSRTAFASVIIDAERLQTIASGQPSYRVLIDTVVNADALAGTRLLRDLGTLLPAMPPRVDASALLSGYAQTWAYRESEHDGPNCWVSAIASTSPSWSRPRYMGPAEFVCHLEHSYERLFVDEPSQLIFGDVVRLVNRAGQEVHAFVYIGPDRSAGGQHIVFTKNGYRRGPYAFQTFDSVVHHIYPNNRQYYYRVAHVASDPSVDERSACRLEYEQAHPRGRDMTSIGLAFGNALR